MSIRCGHPCLSLSLCFLLAFHCFLSNLFSISARLVVPVSMNFFVYLIFLFVLFCFVLSCLV